MNNNLVMDAMRLAEHAHRLIGQFRKAPEGDDRPSYFLHLVEDAWSAASETNRRYRG